jgi:hypothetical protein
MASSDRQAATQNSPTLHRRDRRKRRKRCGMGSLLGPPPTPCALSAGSTDGSCTSMVLALRSPGTWPTPQERQSPRSCTCRCSEHRNCSRATTPQCTKSAVCLDAPERPAGRHDPDRARHAGPVVGAIPVGGSWNPPGTARNSTGVKRHNSSGLGVIMSAAHCSPGRLLCPHLGRHPSRRAWRPRPAPAESCHGRSLRLGGRTRLH